MLSDADLADLRLARGLLEHPGLAMRIADAVGRPVDWLVAKLPRRASGVVLSATRAALDRALDVALRTLGPGATAAPADWLHRGLVVATGAAGGALGLAALPIELPVSTTVMLRSIADHARSQGEDLAAPAARLECLVVFALGGPSRGDDSADVGYFAVRAAFGRAVAEAAQYVAERGLADAAATRGAPALARLVGTIAERFGAAVGDKVAAQLVPIVGAAGGAALNALFIQHFQDTARGHFTVRRLERVHGAAAVRDAWERLGGAGGG